MKKKKHKGLDNPKVEKGMYLVLHKSKNVVRVNYVSSNGETIQIEHLCGSRYLISRTLHKFKIKEIQNWW